MKHAVCLGGAMSQQVYNTLFPYQETCLLAHKTKLDSSGSLGNLRPLDLCVLETNRQTEKKKHLLKPILTKRNKEREIFLSDERAEMLGEELKYLLKQRRDFLNKQQMFGGCNEVHLHAEQSRPSLRRIRLKKDLTLRAMWLQCARLAIGPRFPCMWTYRI